MLLVTEVDADYGLMCLFVFHKDKCDVGRESRRMQYAPLARPQPSHSIYDWINPTAILARQGEVLERQAFSAFGQRRLLTGTWEERATSELPDWNFSFHGQFIDEETGWANYGYRYFQASSGRWPLRDPIGERGGLNLYGMVGNDAVSQVDYLGLALTLFDIGSGTENSYGCTCHIWVYLPKDRRRPGDMHVYDCSGKRIFSTKVRGQGTKGPNGDPLKLHGNTPTGDYDATIEGPQGSDPNGSFGAGPILRITGRGNYNNQPAVGGQGALAKRPGLLNHGGRKNKQTTVLGEPCPHISEGCVRVPEGEMSRLLEAMKGAQKCTKWMEHIVEGSPLNPDNEPFYSDPREQILKLSLF